MVDVAIQFRCGDSHDDPKMGMLPFEYYHAVLRDHSPPPGEPPPTHPNALDLYPKVGFFSFPNAKDQTRGRVFFPGLSISLVQVDQTVIIITRALCPPSLRCVRCARWARCVANCLPQTCAPPGGGGGLCLTPAVGLADHQRDAGEHPPGPRGRPVRVLYGPCPAPTLTACPPLHTIDRQMDRRRGSAHISPPSLGETPWKILEDRYYDRYDRYYDR